MSRFTRLWVLIVPTIAALLLGMVTFPAMAEDPPFPAPVPLDACGSSEDKVFVSDDTDPMSDVSWKDEFGNFYAAGQWNSTNGLPSLTLTVTIYKFGEDVPPYTYPPISFGTEPDSTCVDMLDTVSVTVLECNRSTNGTKVAFTYTNVAENGRPHTEPQLLASRWDGGQTAIFHFSYGEVADGQSATVIGGDTLTTGFFLAPGTYGMRLNTKETGLRKLPNRFFVPACGKYAVPPGDPSGQGKSIMPKGWLQQVDRKAIMKMRAINRKVTHATIFRLKIDPRHGKTTVRTFKAKPNMVVRKAYRGKVGTKFVLRAKVKVDGKWKWRVMKRSMMRSQGS